MSSFDQIVTLSLDDASILEQAALKAVAVCRAKTPAECLAIECAVIWAAGYWSDQATVEAIAALAVQRYEAAGRSSARF